jgi:hypothetical protein
VDLSYIDTENFRIGWPKPTIYREHEVIHLMANALDEALKQIKSLRQSLWDVYEALGFDTDGDPTPDAVVNLGQVVVEAAREHRQDSNDARTPPDRDDEPTLPAKETT